jgi:predicted nucleic acid-binding protein
VQRGKKSTLSTSKSPKEAIREPEIASINNATDCVLDAGLLLRYFSKTSSFLQEWLDANLFTKDSSILIHCHIISRTEVYYITCRDIGGEEAKKLLEKLDLLVITHNEYMLAELAGKVKCAHSIALGDCFSIATAQMLKCPVLFKQERELTKEVVDFIQRKFGVQAIVLPMLH